MERGETEDLLWKTLSQCGLVGKKLAVFTGEDAWSIATQLCKKLGIVCEQWHADLVTTWIGDAVRAEPMAKRLRGDVSLDPLDANLLEERMSFGNHSSSSSSSNIVSVSIVPETRPSRRKPQEEGEEHARKLRDDHLKELWSHELYSELKKIEAPVLDHLEHCVSDRHLHLALAGRTRYNTLKRYIKTWMAFTQWLHAAKVVVEYPVPGDLVEYLFARYDEPCGPTIPVLIVKAVTWFEKVACLDVRARIGETHVVASVRDYIVEMLSKDSAPTKRAPRYPAVFLESLEAMVDNEALVLGMRLVAWIKLVKIWASLRWDDIQKIIPKELKATVPTGLALLRVSRDERDMLGRWKPEGSDTYIRMYNGVVSRLQHQFAVAVRSPNRTGLLDERDVVESAHSWLVERCEQLPEAQLMAVLAHLEESLSWQVQPGWDTAGEVEELVDVGVTEQERLEHLSTEPLEKIGVIDKENRKPMYVVVETSKRCKRLHKSRGGCWMGREMTFKTSTEFFQLPDESAYTHVCKVCWPRNRPTGTTEGSSSSSSTSSSGSVSSSDERNSNAD
eukprot:s1116_g17.t1